MEKYTIKSDDWSDISLVDIKMKAQSVVSLFIILENTLAPHITPEETELIEDTKNKLLSYLDKTFIDNK